MATRRPFVDEVKRLKCPVKHLTDKKLKSAMMASLQTLEAGDRKDHGGDVAGGLSRVGKDCGGEGVGNP